MYEQWRKEFRLVTSQGSFNHAAHAPFAKWREVALKALEGTPRILRDPSSATRRALEAALTRRVRPLVAAFVELALRMAIGTCGPTAKAAAS